MGKRRSNPAEVVDDGDDNLVAYLGSIREGVEDYSFTRLIDARERLTALSGGSYKLQLAIGVKLPDDDQRIGKDLTYCLKLIEEEIARRKHPDFKDF